MLRIRERQGGTSLVVGVGVEVPRAVRTGNLEMLKLPKLRSNPQSKVMNDQETRWEGEGSHWCGLWRKENKVNKRKEAKTRCSRL